MLPSDYEAVTGKYRERRQAELVAKQQRASGEVSDRRARDERRERWVAPVDQLVTGLRPDVGWSARMTCCSCDALQT
jgi:hypothetical protein